MVEAKKPRLVDDEEMKPGTEAENTVEGATPLREAKRVADATDIECLWFDPALGDGITNTTSHSPSWSASRRIFSARLPIRTTAAAGEMYVHKVEGDVRRDALHPRPSMRGMIPEATPCVTLVTVVYRDGTPRLWPVKHARGEHDNRHGSPRARPPRPDGDSGSNWSGSATPTRRAMRCQATRRIRLLEAAAVRRTRAVGLRRIRHHQRHEAIRSIANCSVCRPRSRRMVAMISNTHARVGSHWRDLRSERFGCRHRILSLDADSTMVDGGGPAHPSMPRRNEMRSNRVVRQWQDEFGRPPYRLGADSLIIAYINTAEFGTHIALGWGQPACSIDAYIEFRHYTNDGRIKGGDRDKGFYSIDGALRYFGEDGIDTAHKTDMRDAHHAGSAVHRPRARRYSGLLPDRR